MKARLTVFACIFLALSVSLAAQQQQEQKYTLESDKLLQQSKELDQQILDLNTKIKNTIARYKLLTLKNIRTLPYQTTFKQGNGFIEMERHLFLRDEIYKQNIFGIKTKRIRIYTDGTNVSKIETTIFEKYFNSEEIYTVTVVDPSPVAAGTDDIIFTHKEKGLLYLDKKPLGEIKNTTAFPTRNDIKQDFIIPTLDYFLNALMSIGDSYYKGLKDADSNMAEFLRKSVTY